ncbi:ABC-2 family transporter protein [Paenibacillus sp. M1]|uniref:ABC-2 family transporter protein n=1 Tax=Paenibacillus haidiansis TaxID=1574488 RepID=A0ABU7VRM1_9BACL
MRKYIHLFYLSFRTSKAYKFEIWLGILNAVLMLCIQVFLWKVLYAKNPENIGLSQQEMVTYFILASGLSASLFNTSVIDEMVTDVRDGKITHYLNKPYSYKLSLLSKFLGRSLFTVLFIVVPMFILGILFFGFESPNDPAALLLSLGIVIISFLIFFHIFYIAGLSVFWFMDLHGAVKLLLDNGIKILSGAYIPLWLFPGWLHNIANILPLRTGADLPITIYLGKNGYEDIALKLMFNVGWLILLWITSAIIWRIGLRKLVIQGG